MTTAAELKRILAEGLPPAARMAFDAIDDAGDEGDKEVAKAFKHAKRAFVGFLKKTTGETWRAHAGEDLFSLTGPKGKVIDIYWEWDPMFDKATVTVEGPGRKRRTQQVSLPEFKKMGGMSAASKLLWLQFGENVERWLGPALAEDGMFLDEGLRRPKWVATKLDISSLGKAQGVKFVYFTQPAHGTGSFSSFEAHRYIDSDQWAGQILRTGAKYDFNRARTYTDKRILDLFEKGQGNLGGEGGGSSRGKAWVAAASIFGEDEDMSLATELRSIMDEGAKGGKASRAAAQSGHGWSRNEKKAHTKGQVRRSKKKDIERRLQDEDIDGALQVLIDEGVDLGELLERGGQVDMERSLNMLVSEAQNTTAMGKAIESWAYDGLATKKMDVRKLQTLARLIDKTAKNLKGAIARFITATAMDEQVTEGDDSEGCEEGCECEDCKKKGRKPKKESLANELTSILQAEGRRGFTMPDSPEERAVKGGDPKFKAYMKSLTGKANPSYNDILKALVAQGLDDRAARQYAMFAAEKFDDAPDKRAARAQTRGF